MEIYKNYDLYRHNTMRLHCITNEVFIPASIEELVNLVKDLNYKGKRYKLLGAGSNIILPKRLDASVIVLTKSADSIEFHERTVKCGASVRIQKFIRECQKKELGGIEYLFSVPCNMGGATVQNAGRGQEYNESIEKYITAVTCLNTDTLEIERLSNKDCKFNYRSSIFQQGKRLVLFTELNLIELTSSEIEDRIKARLNFAKTYLDDKHPSSGSIFNLSSSFIMKQLKGLRIGGAMWSGKTTNWICNVKHAKNWQVKLLIYIAVFLHKITFRPYRLEVEIW